MAKPKYVTAMNYHPLYCCNHIGLPFEDHRQFHKYVAGKKPITEANHIPANINSRRKSMVWIFILLVNNVPNDAKTLLFFCLFACLLASSHFRFIEFPLVQSVQAINTTKTKTENNTAAKYIDCINASIVTIKNVAIFGT